MALTTRVKEELVRVTVKRDASRIAELASLLRFSATIDVVGDRLVIEADVESMDTARRIRDSVRDLYGHGAVIRAVGAGGARRTRSYTVTVTDGARETVRRVGLVSPSGHLVRGLPPRVVSGTVSDAEAAWRGAFLAHGSLTEPGRSSALEIVCPCPEAALALVGCARRLGITAKTRESRGTDRVTVRDSEAIGALLTRMGAQRSRLEWEEQRTRREVRTSTNRLANFDDANLRRSARAAVAAAARVERALEILGEDVPDHLAEAGKLRVQHRQASLEELGRLADPQMTKDAVAGRIRRLLSMADRRAVELGVPKTSEAVTEHLFSGDS